MLEQKPFFITVPHSGEEIPAEVIWLKGLSEAHLMRDVDRFVDQLYKPVVNKLQISYIVARWHRYVIDLNRKVEEIDQDSVRGSDNPSGTHTRGLHWSKTTFSEILISEPMSSSLHKSLIKKCFNPFHQEIRQQFEKFQSSGFKKVYHLDAHSMPSLGRAAHRDLGEHRMDIVVSDEISEGQASCDSSFTELVKFAFEKQNFSVGHNWPYKGGGITKNYGRIEKGQHTLQVEINRKLYMNEETKKINKKVAETLSQRIEKAISLIFNRLPIS